MRSIRRIWLVLNGIFQGCASPVLLEVIAGPAEYILREMLYRGFGNEKEWKWK